MIKKMVLAFLKSNNSMVSAIWYLMGTVLVQGINFIMTPIYTNMMSVSDYGMISICTMWISIFSTFVTLQVHGSVNNALVKYGPQNISSYVSSIQSLESISFAVIFVICYIFRNTLAQLLRIPEIIFVTIIIVSFLQSCIQLLFSQLIAQKKHKQYFFISLLFTILSSAFSVFFIYMAHDGYKYYGKVFGLLVATAAVGIIVYIYIYHKGRTVFNKQYCKFCLTLTLPLIFHSLSQIILGQSDRYMLKILLQNADFHVGIYGYAHTLGAIINVLWLAFNYAWVPWYYKKRTEGNLKTIKKVLAEYCIIFTAMTVIFIFVSPEIVQIMAPKEYWSSMNMVPIIALGFFCMFLYSFPVNYEFHQEKTIWISIGTVLAAIVNIVLNYFAIPKYGSMGAAASTLLSYLFLFVFHFLISKFAVKNYEVSFLNLLKYLAPFPFVVLIYYCTLDLFVLRLILCTIIVAFLAYRYIKMYRMATTQGK